jgi:CHASE3 domain sensor protein
LETAPLLSVSPIDLQRVLNFAFAWPICQWTKWPACCGSSEAANLNGDPMLNHWSLKRRLTLTFAAILMLAVALISVALVNTGKLRDTVNWNTHTRKVLAEADSMLLNMVNIETGLRGFVAGGQEKFLEPFNAGQQAFGLAFKEAKSLTSDNPAQQGRLDKLMDNHQQFRSNCAPATPAA